MEKLKQQHAKEMDQLRVEYEKKLDEMKINTTVRAAVRVMIAKTNGYRLKQTRSCRRRVTRLPISARWYQNSVMLISTRGS